MRKSSMRRAIVIMIAALIVCFAGIIEAHASSGWLFTITNVTLDKDVVQWGEDITVTIEYEGDHEPLLGKITFRNAEVNTVSELGLFTAGTQFYVPAEGDTVNDPEVVRHSYDAETQSGVLVLRFHISCREYAGTYNFYSVCFEDWYEFSLPPGCKMDYSQISSEDTKFTVKSPFGDVAAEKVYSDADLIDTLEALDDGDVAIIRCQAVKEELVPEEKRIPDQEGAGYSVIKKEYFDAVKGKNVTLLFPSWAGYFAEINGESVSDDTQDVYLAAMSQSVNPWEEGIVIEITYPNNGPLPAVFTYWYEYEEWYSSLTDNPPRYYSRSEFDQYLEESKLYYINRGKLQNESKQMERTPCWIGIGILHNSKFLLTDITASKLKTFTASAAKTLTYTGKTAKPKVKIEDGGIGDKYSIAYSNKSSKDVGTYKISVTATKKGYGTQSLSYKILPKGTSLGTLKGKKKAVVVKWKKQGLKMSKKRIAGYNIQYSTKKKSIAKGKIVKVKGYKNVSKTIKKLKKKKTYYLRIRTYMVVSGKTYYSSWSKIKTVKTK